MSEKEDYLKGLSLLSKNESNYPTSPDEAQLESFENRFQGRDYEITFECPEFTSLCPVTGQPDFGTIYITYTPDKKCIESKSLKLYLFSYRTFQTFHEEVVNRVLNDFVKICEPKHCTVYGDFCPRGGISLKITAEYDREIDGLPE
ncbi:MAG: preQ(1) synthase [Lentisphaeria bacterium]|nr:preQ(1) synthase [Lentisphaeria bacterium]